MKTPVKKLKWVWGAFAVLVVVSIAVYIITPSHHELARDPNNIEKILKLDLPDIKHVESEDNMDRGASRWNWYAHDIQFSEPLSEDCIKELERRCVEDAKHWKKNAGGDGFTYEDCENYDEYCVDCSLYREHAHLEYSIDEDEDIMLFAIIYIGFLFSPLVGVICVVLYMAIKEFVDERYRQAK